MSGRRLAIVMGVVILLGSAYATHTIRKEKIAHFQRAAALSDNLAAMRNAIKTFHGQEGRYPRSLDELVPKYLRRIPRDPVTGEGTWRLTTEQTVQPSSDFSTATPAKSDTFVIDVHSTASGKDADGKPFADY